MKRILIITICITISEIGLAQGQWTKKADFINVREQAIGFSIGNKGYVGCGAGYGIADTFNDFWEYNASNNTWAQKANIGVLARIGALSFNIGNKGYVGGGYIMRRTQGTIDSLYIIAFSDFWEYDVDSNYWTRRADLPTGARMWGAGFSINNSGYITCGKDATGYKNDLWEYKPDSNRWYPKTNFPGSARSRPVAFAIGNNGYVGTGFSPTGTSTNKDFWKYDPATNTWNRIKDLDSSRYLAFGFSIGNKGYVGCGISFTNYYKDFIEYNPDSDVWRQKANFGNNSNRSSTISFSIGNKGYVGLGYDSADTKYKDFWEYAPWSTGVSEIGKTEYFLLHPTLRIYPNPTTGIFIIEIKAKGKAEITVTDILGKALYIELSQKITDNFSKEINLSGADAGLYFVKVKVGDKIYTNKIIIQ